MNACNLSPQVKITKTNGKVLPIFDRLFRESNTVPYYKTSLPWMAKEQKFTYKADRLKYQSYANVLQEEYPTSPEIYYENKLYETVVGALLREYFGKRDPRMKFYYASKYDDYCSSSDYIVNKPGSRDEYVRIDLTVSEAEVLSFEQNHSHPTLNKKINRFQNSSGIPEEFFEVVKPHETPKPLPLIIIRMDRSILCGFVHDFFRTMALKDPKVDILEYFSTWIHHNSHIHQERIAYILGMDNTQTDSRYPEDNITELATQIGELFA